jgi:hypothetical protein
MTKKALVASASLLAVLLPAAAAHAQTAVAPDSPAWLADRRYNEGVGIKSGDLELHPGIAGEAGYDSNWFMRSQNNGFLNSAPTAPIQGAAVFRITPSLYLATLGPQRREGDLHAEPPAVRFRAGINATYREFLSAGGTDASLPQNDVTKQRNVSVGSDARLDIGPERPFGAGLFANYVRTVQPNTVTADPNSSFVRDDIGVGGELIAQPGGGTLDWHFGYQFHDTIFETSDAAAYDNMTHELFTRGRWRFRPRTSLVYDATFRFISYVNQANALQNGLVNSDPIRARIGLNGLVTDRFAFLGLVGWGASFYDASQIKTQPQYDSVIGQAELKWFLSASPGLQQSSDVGLSLSSIALGYTRDFQNSYLGGYYGTDRGYLKFSYFFAGRALLSLEGGLGAIEYPNMFWGDGTSRHTSFTDLRADATLFGEYRFTDSFGLNVTGRYTANFSNTSVPGYPPSQLAGQPVGPANSYDMSWNRIEAFLGVRWFM